ncbi:hypothetical protein [Solicola sp. PLA-1-18]|uniref:hypothetical protein n=1 Tax=Solicola sp. PLA-1-18 TaxID=3380532 RepID=UPI003B7DE004
MSTDLDLQTIENAAKELLDTRVDAVRTLARARADVAAQAEQLRTAEAADKAAYDAAIKAGWTPDELRKVGLAAPGKTRRGPRGPNRRTRTTSTEETATPDDAQTARGL